MSNIATFDMVLDSVVGAITGKAPITSHNSNYQELYERLHDGQKRIADDTHRFKVVVCGRRWGKNRVW